MATSPMNVWFARGGKRQRESCAKYRLCHLFSPFWHLCKSPLLYCLPFDNKAKSQWFIVFISEVVQNSCSMVSKSIRWLCPVSQSLVSIRTCRITWKNDKKWNKAGLYNSFMSWQHELMYFKSTFRHAVDHIAWQKTVLKVNTKQK